MVRPGNGRESFLLYKRRNFHLVSIIFIIYYYIHAMGDAELVDESLRRAAENEMRRCLPSGDRPIKRAKTEKDEQSYPEIGRFDYNCSSELTEGVTCFLISCDFKRYGNCLCISLFLIFNKITPDVNPIHIFTVKGVLLEKLLHCYFLF